jgi:hypothetical protein
MRARHEFADCLTRLEEEVKACVEGGGDPETCRARAERLCKERINAFLERCIKACRQDPPPPEPPTCPERCRHAAAKVKEECLAAGGSEEDCAQAVEEFLAKCRQACDRPPPDGCDIDCEKAAEEIRARCLAAGGSEEDCARKAREFLAHCRDRVAEHCAEENLALGAAPRDFTRGDANGDGTRDISDPMAILNRLFLGQGVLVCEDAADADDNGSLNITAPVAILDWLFRGGNALPEPSGAPGPDPTADGLICQ